mgnify:CR=1 FL=1
MSGSTPLRAENKPKVDPSGPFDAIVVGAGPAGSMAAWRLASLGRRVVLLERGQQPGGKNLFGGMISMLFLSIHFVDTPMLCMISIRRFTSSMREMPRRTVLSLLMSAAQSRTTEPFLEKLVGMEPESFRPPTTLKSRDSDMHWI